MSEHRKLEILGDAPNYISKKGVLSKYNVRVRCYCGNEFVAKKHTLTAGRRVSCGCSFKAYRKTQPHPHTTHGTSRHPLYLVWNGMKMRCINPNHFAYKRYGGRGIKVCDDWLNHPNLFVEWAINNGWKKGLHVDRINNDGNYEPENCRCVTAKVNGLNRANSLYLTFNGERKYIKDWCKEYNMPYSTARTRYKQGRSFEDIFKLNKKDKMVDRELASKLKVTLKDSGRKQRWLIDKCKERNILISESQMSNKLNGVEVFTEVEYDTIIDIFKKANLQVA